MERIFAACILTIIIESPFLLAVGYRSKSFAAISVCVNAATNLTLNLLAWLLYYMGVELSFVVYPMEIAVVAAEYLVYAALEGRSARLFLMTLSANVLSYCAGLLLFGHV